MPPQAAVDREFEKALARLRITDEEFAALRKLKQRCASFNLPLDVDGLIWHCGGTTDFGEED